MSFVRRYDLSSTLYGFPLGPLCSTTLLLVIILKLCSRLNDHSPFWCTDKCHPQFHQLLVPHFPLMSFWVRAAHRRLCPAARTPRCIRPWGCACGCPHWVVFYGKVIWIMGLGAQLLVSQGQGIYYLLVKEWVYENSITWSLLQHIVNPCLQETF